jgi:ferric-dicitrate binding protein FerR (iron transport regulator)
VIGLAKKKAAKVATAATAVQTSPYVQRIVQDEDLRDNARAALEAARDAFDRLSSTKKPPAKALMEDKKLQKSLQEAAVNLRDAGTALRDGPQKKKGKLGRRLLLLIVAAGAALGFSEPLRNKVLDALFGKEEEFEYTSTTSPPTPAPPAPAPSTPAG